MLQEPESQLEPEPEVKQVNTAVISTKVSQGIFIYDFETVPDESRFPRPEPEAVPERVSYPDREDIDLNDVVKEGVPKIKSIIESHLSDSQLNELLSLEKAAKSRKGVVDAINAALGADEAAVADTNFRNQKTEEAWRKEGSVNPLKARIVAFGWAYREGEIHTMTATNDDEERAILKQFWLLVTQCKRRCGYNILHFDDMLAVIRSLVLGVEIPRALDRRKYSNREAIDLMVALFPSGSPQKCKDVVRLLGIEPPAGDVDGSQVFELYQQGKIKEIGEYVGSDVYVERELYLLLVDALTF